MLCLIKYELDTMFLLFKTDYKQLLFLYKSYMFISTEEERI